ncbi:hypothetical protein ASC68_19430 [Devosia sp. Root105]|nr:hypothetical protein ASC68_19430 [Devosia sp. Root105]
MINQMNRLEFDYDTQLVVLQSQITADATNFINSITSRLHSVPADVLNKLPKAEWNEWRIQRNKLENATTMVLLLCEPGVSESMISATSEFRVRVQITHPDVGAPRLEVVFAYHDDELQRSLFDALASLIP